MKTETRAPTTAANPAISITRLEENLKHVRRPRARFAPAISFVVVSRFSVHFPRYQVKGKDERLNSPYRKEQ
jgi:hypothetical protein